MGSCDHLARLLEYPDEDYRQAIELCRQSLAAAEPEAARHLEGFARSLGGLRTEQQQELFVQTFDLNPVCALEVGWQLYGDEYRRGEFLARMRRELASHQLPESRELPDHLTHTLRLLPRLEPEEADQFAALFVLPALEKMLAGLSGKQNPFEALLSAIRIVLSRRHSPVSRRAGGEA